MVYVLTFANKGTTEAAIASVRATSPANTLSGGVEAYCQANFNAPLEQNSNYASTADLGFCRRATKFLHNGHTASHGRLTPAVVKSLFVSYSVNRQAEN